MCMEQLGCWVSSLNKRPLGAHNSDLLLCISSTSAGPAIGLLSEHWPGRASEI